MMTVPLFSPVAEPDVIERCRQRATVGTDAFQPTVAELRQLVDALISGHRSPAEVADTIGWTADETMTCVGRLGTYLSQSNKQNPVPATVDIVEAAATATLPLFQTASLTADPPNRRRKASHLTVWIPHGWERGATGRNFARSVTNIVWHQPDDATLTRFIERTYPPMNRHELDMAALFGVWLFDHVGRVDELDQVWDQPGLADLIVRSWELLADVINDAARALRLLHAGKIGTLDELDDAVAKLSPLAEGEVARLRACIDAARVDETAAAGPLTALVRQLLERTRSRPWWLPATVGGLNHGQLTRIWARTVEPAIAPVQDAVEPLALAA